MNFTPRVKETITCASKIHELYNCSLFVALLRIRRQRRLYTPVFLSIATTVKVIFGTLASTRNYTIVHSGRIAIYSSRNSFRTYTWTPRLRVIYRL